MPTAIKVPEVVTSSCDKVRYFAVNGASMLHHKEHQLSESTPDNGGRIL